MIGLAPLRPRREIRRRRASRLPSFAGGRTVASRPILPWILALALVVTGCETRERDNPFDPENPNTGGAPPAIDALAGDGQIELSWDLSAYEGIARVALERAAGSERPVLLDPSLGVTGGRTDLTVRNGTTYAYRLLLETGSGDLLESGAELATPGASIVWYGDAVGFGIGRLAPDGRDRLFRSLSGGTILDLAVDLDGAVWAADFWNGRVVQVDRAGEAVRILDRPGANTVAYEVVSAQLWVGSYLERSVSRYAVADGRQTLILEDVGLTEDLEVEPFPGSGAWVATRDNGLLRIENEAIAQRWSSFEWPVALSRDPGGILWVIDRGRRSVSRLRSITGIVLPSDVVLLDPRDCTLDGSGGIWVADPGRGGVIHVDSEGVESGFLALGGATGVTRDPVTGLLWVVFRDPGEIGVYGPEGTEHARIRVGGSPVKIEGFWN